MNVKNYNMHTLFLIALSVLGNGCIVMPFLNTKSPILSFLLCAALTVAIAAIALPIINCAFAKKGVLFYAVSAAVAALSLYGAAYSFADYINFLTAIDSNRISSILLLGVVVAAATFSSDSAFFKFTMLFGSVTIFFIVVLFIMSSGIYNLQNIKINFEALNFKGAVLCFLKYFSVCLSALGFAALSKHKTNIKITLSGLAVGLLAAALCLLQSILVLGTTATQYTYPYIAAVGAYSSGQLYIRQDGLVWFVFFSTTIIKTALCSKTVWVIIKEILKG